MDDLKRFFINGKWVLPNSKKGFPVIDPSNEQVIGEIILGNSQDVEKAVSAAKNAFKLFSKTSKEERL